MKLSIDIEYILKRIIVIVLAFVIISSIKSCNVQAASCSSETISKSYYLNSQWTQFTNNPMQFNTEVDKVSIRFNNNGIQNKAIIKHTHSNVTVNGPHFNDPVITVYLKDGTNQSDISSNCTNSISHSCASQNDSLCLSTIYSITTNCVFTSTNSNANLIEIQYGSSQGIIRFYNDNNCLQISPTDTQQIIESQNNNSQNIIDSINDNSEVIDRELSNINESINNIFNNIGSCKDLSHDISIKNKYLNSSGSLVDSNNYGVSNYYTLYDGLSIDRIHESTDSVYMCFYNKNKVLISCETERQIVPVSIPSGSKYVRFSWSLVDEYPIIRYCSKSDQVLQGFLSDSGVGQSIIDKGNSFFSQEVDTANNGLVSVITAPITILQRATDTCSSKSFVLFGNTISLPCGSTLFWEKDFSNYNSIFNSGLTGSGLNVARDDFRLFWNVFFGGAIILHLLVKLFMVISDALDPDSCTVRSINSAIDTSDVSSYVPKHSYEVNESKRLSANSTGMSRSLKNRDIYVSTGGAKYYG